MSDPSDSSLKGIMIALADFIEESFDIVHLKDIQTGKYIQVSPGFVKKLGLESTHEVVGLTVNDLVTHQKIWGGKDFSQAFIYWKNKQLKIFKELDQQAQVTKRRVNRETVFFSPEGYILVQNTVKIPFFDQKNEEVIAIYTYSRDFTFQCSLNHLFKLYMEYYPEIQAIQHLLMYLEIDGYFNELPNIEEMKVLFSIHQHFDISDEMIHSAHFLSLRNKVETDNWQEMLLRLHVVPAI